MVVLNFERWSHAALEKYLYDRIYLATDGGHFGWKWTPFCWRIKRYAAKA